MKRNMPTPPASYYRNTQYYLPYRYIGREPNEERIVVWMSRGVPNVPAFKGKPGEVRHETFFDMVQSPMAPISTMRAYGSSSKLRAQSLACAIGRKVRELGYDTVKSDLQEVLYKGMLPRRDRVPTVHTVKVGISDVNVTYGPGEEEEPLICTQLCTQWEYLYELERMGRGYSHRQRFKCDVLGVFVVNVRLISHVKHQYPHAGIVYRGPEGTWLEDPTLERAPAYVGEPKEWTDENPDQFVPAPRPFRSVWDEPVEDFVADDLPCEYREADFKKVDPDYWGDDL